VGKETKENKLKKEKIQQKNKSNLGGEPCQNTCLQKSEGLR
jgi:hypothetical protein